MIVVTGHPHNARVQVPNGPSFKPDLPLPGRGQQNAFPSGKSQPKKDGWKAGFKASNVSNASNASNYLGHWVAWKYKRTGRAMRKGPTSLMI